jgi:hypothetical protein
MKEFTMALYFRYNDDIMRSVRMLEGAADPTPPAIPTSRYLSCPDPSEPTIYQGL